MVTSKSKGCSVEAGKRGDVVFLEARCQYEGNFLNPQSKVLYKVKLGIVISSFVDGEGEECRGAVLVFWLPEPPLHHSLPMVTLPHTLC